MYLRIWEYEVLPEVADRFVAAYGSSGPWAQLFAVADGFGGTELFRSVTSGRFVTIDRWRDEADWRAFLGQQQEAYRSLDRSLAELTAVELPLFEGTVPAPAPPPGRAGDGATPAGDP